MIGWRKELPQGSFLLSDEPDALIDEAKGNPVRGAQVVIPADVLERIDAYETSTPTAPSPGRIYRRTYYRDWDVARAQRRRPEDPYSVVFFVVDDPHYGDGKQQAHVPYEALVL